MNDTPATILAVNLTIRQICNKYNMGMKAFEVLMMFNEVNKPVTINDIANILEQDPKSLYHALLLLFDYKFIQPSQIMTDKEIIKMFHAVTEKGISVLNDYYYTYQENKKIIKSK